jgi:hypothetical protein
MVTFTGKTYLSDNFCLCSICAKHLSCKTAMDMRGVCHWNKHCVKECIHFSQGRIENKKPICPCGLE